MPRTVRRLLAVVPLLAAVATCGGEPAPEQARNVVLIVADTLRGDRLGCYGYARPTSPHIDALAARGTLYQDCYSQANWTVPSMISLMSGASVCQEDVALPAGLELLAEAVQGRGLATAGFTANPVLYTDRGFERGLDVFEDVSELTAPKVAEHAGDWVEALPRDAEGRPERFFLWIQFFDPHAPYTPQPEYDRFGGPRPDQATLEPRWRAAQTDAAALDAAGGSRDLEDSLAFMLQESNRYDGEVLQTDAGVGRLLERLARLGVLDQTLVVLCADHGEMLYERRTQPVFVTAALASAEGQPVGVEALFTQGHRPWYYEPLWNTPLILAGPGFPAGERREGLVANLDIYPTVLEALGARPSRPLEGRSLVGGRDLARERVHAYGQRTSAVVEQDGLKLVLQPLRMFEQGEAIEPRVPWLLDVHQDEREELSSQRPADVERLVGRIKDWHARYGRAPEGQTSEAALRELRRLGYIGDDEPEGGER